MPGLPLGGPGILLLKKRKKNEMMTVEKLKEAGVKVVNHVINDRRGHISDPLRIIVTYARGEHKLECTVYKKHDDPRREYVFQEKDYLRLFADLINLSVADYMILTDGKPQYQGQFHKLSLQYQKIALERWLEFQQRVHEFLK